MTVLSYKSTKAKVTISAPSNSSSVEEIIFEEKYVDTSKIHKRGSKLPGYKGGRLPIHNVESRGKALEVPNMCDTPRFQKVR